MYICKEYCKSILVLLLSLFMIFYKVIISHGLWYKHIFKVKKKKEKPCPFSLALHVAAVVQLLSRVQLFETPWAASRQASLSFSISWSLSNSCPFSQWCHLTISSSVVPFSFCLQSFLASESFLMSPFFTSGGQSICFSISPSNEYSGLIFRTDWLVWSSCCPRDSQESSPNLTLTLTLTLTVRRHQLFSAQTSLWSNSHIHTWLLEKP